MWATVVIPFVFHHGCRSSDHTVGAPSLLRTFVPFSRMIFNRAQTPTFFVFHNGLDLMVPFTVILTFWPTLNVFGGIRINERTGTNTPVEIRWIICNAIGNC